MSSDDEVMEIHVQNPLPRLPIYIGECCREWPLAIGIPVGRCGICGERPEFKRMDDPDQPPPGHVWVGCPAEDCTVRAPVLPSMRFAAHTLVCRQHHLRYVPLGDS